MEIFLASIFYLIPLIYNSLWVKYAFSNEGIMDSKNIPTQFHILSWVPILNIFGFSVFALINPFIQETKREMYLFILLIILITLISVTLGYKIVN